MTEINREENIGAHVTRDLSDGNLRWQNVDAYASHCG